MRASAGKAGAGTHRRHRLLILLLAAAAAVCLSAPCKAMGGASLKNTLPQEARELLESVSPESGDVRRGAESLWQGAVSRLRSSLREAVKDAFLITAVCLLLSMVKSYAAGSGTTPPGDAVAMTGATVILLLTLKSSGSLLLQCRQAVSGMDSFQKLFTTVFAAASAAAGRPASAAAMAGAAMLFADVIYQTALRAVFPLLQTFLLLHYGGVAAKNGALTQAARAVKWLTVHGFRLLLTAYFGYLSLTGLVTGAADAAAVRTAQTLSSAIPVVGNILSGAAETVLSGAAAVRAGIGLFGVLAAAALCLTPLIAACAHLLVFRLLSFFAASFTEGGVQTMLQAVADLYRMITGLLAACCALQFITVAVALTVTAV
ncbi:MAG: hypothetical protein IK141_06185 [Clostridia bacterium]|nr:hypothetical protein [Clostridia bacterium]